MNSSQKGFTLIELLITISLMALLATFGIITFAGAQAKARDAQRKSDLKNIQNGLRLYFNDFGSYPTSNANLALLACGATSPCNTACSWGGAWSCGSQTYMNVLPKEPKSAASYRYTYVDRDNYILDACLENKNDTSGITAGGTSWCSTNWMFEIKP